MQYTDNSNEVSAPIAPK